MATKVDANELFKRHMLQLHFVGEGLVLLIDKQNMLPVGNFLKRSRYDDKTGEPDISHLTRQHETPPILLLLHDHRGIGGCLALPCHSEHPLRLAAQGRHLLRLVPQGGWVGARSRNWCCNGSARSCTTVSFSPFNGISDQISIKVRIGATRLPHSHRNKAGAVVARKWCKVEGNRARVVRVTKFITPKMFVSSGYDPLGRGSGMTNLCDASAYGADRVCDIPKMLRHRYDSLQCSCNFPSWMGK